MCRDELLSELNKYTSDMEGLIKLTNEQLKQQLAIEINFANNMIGLTKDLAKLSKE